MKTFLIGRDLNCDIVITDTTDVVSRRHAILTILSSGKMTITDQSNNGTYVNGIRIAQNVAVPVSRKDSISFAHVAKLDWNLIPKKRNPVPYIVGFLFILIIILAVLISIWNGHHKHNNSYIITPGDSILYEEEKPIYDDSLKTNNKDSLNIKIEDSDKDTIRSISTDSVKTKKTPAKPARIKKEKIKEDKKEDDNINTRPIG